MKFVERTWAYPLISVIIAGVRCDEALIRSIRSVQNQSYQNLEILCITAEECDGACEEPRTSGHTVASYTQSSAFNYGLSLCTGDAVLLLPCGDEIHSEFLEKGNEWLQLFDASAVQCATMVEKESVIDSIELPSGTRRAFSRNLMEGKPFYLHSFLIRSDVCSAFREDLNHSHISDFLFSSLHGKKVVTKGEYIGAFCSAGASEREEQNIHAAMEVSLMLAGHLDTLKDPLIRFNAIRRMSGIYVCYKE
ncbi:MAG: hypothetical protein JXK93_12705, partial [Sphaerochaetaceae bacterium]|nr:hypothetical protein [Sphaerochaetaceae bacterium]